MGTVPNKGLLYIKHDGLRQNIRTQPTIIGDTTSRVIEKGMLFTQEAIRQKLYDIPSDYDYPNAIASFDSCITSTKWFGLTTRHDVFTFAQIEGFFRPLIRDYWIMDGSRRTAEYETGFAFCDHIVPYNPNMSDYEHADGMANCPVYEHPDTVLNKHADSTLGLDNTSKPFLNHIYDELRKDGWDGASDFHTPYKRFAYREGYYGVQLNSHAEVFNANKYVLEVLSPADWVWFTWGSPPVVGSTEKAWIRIAGRSWGDSAFADDITKEIAYVDAGLDRTGEKPVYTGYNIATMYDDLLDQSYWGL